MTRYDVERAVELAMSRTLEEIMAMAVERQRKDARIGPWACSRHASSA